MFITPNRSLYRSVLSVTVVLVALFVWGAGSSQAWERKRSGTFKDRSGRSGTYDRSIKTEDGKMKRETTVHSERGDTVHSSESAWDKETGTGTRTSTTTGPDGKTVTTETGLTRNEDGTLAVTKEHTGPDGKTLTTNKTVEKTEDGLKSTGTYTTGKGRSGKFGTEVKKDEEGLSRTVTREGRRGRERSHTGTITRTGP